MYIQSIEIKNFRRFAEYRCDFDPRFTLLMGANGVGKSSLLRAVRAGTDSILTRLGVGGFNLPADDVRRVDTLDPAGERWRTPVYPASVALIMSVHQKTLQIGCERSSETNQGLLFGTGSVFDSQLARWNPGPHTEEALPLFACFEAASPRGEAKQGMVQKPFETKQQIWQHAREANLGTKHLAQWFQYNELRTLQEGQPPLIYRIARQAVLSAIHAEDIRYLVRDDRLMVRFPGEGWQAFDQLSDGQRRISAIFCDLAMCCAALNSHLGERCIVDTVGLVTIDELDLHLHPNWQRSIVGDLLRVFPSLQFIVASHSPFLLQAVFEHGKVLDVASAQFVEPSDPSIEDIAESVMDVDHPQRGRRFLELKQTAQEFYDLLEAKTSTPDEEAALKAKLDVAMAQFANDPASAAWLEQRRLAAGR